MPAGAGNRNLGYDLEEDQTMVLRVQHVPCGGRCHFVVLSPVAWDHPSK